MKTIYKTYKCRMYPTASQKELLDRHFGCVRFVYNYFLNDRKEQYKATGKSDNFFAQEKKLTVLKRNENFSWLKEVNSQSLQYALRCIDTAYVNFFKGNARFPQFKSKRNRNSFAVPQRCSVVGNTVVLPKFKAPIKIKASREILGKVNSMTVSKDCDGKYYVSILSEQEYEPIEKTNSVVGIDLGLKDFVVTSDGRKYARHKFLSKYEKRLKRAQKHLSRKRKGSHSSEKQRRKVASIHKKVANSRNDMLHKVSTDLVRKYDVICCEDLNVKSMMKNHKLAKSISDASWGTFITYLQYKCEREDKQLIKINRWFPSSQICSKCGHINKSTKNLSVRMWKCPNCGASHDRDVNAAINILNEGTKTNTSAGTVDYTGGDGVRLLDNKSSRLRSRKPTGL
jgi:putative transposase